MIGEQFTTLAFCVYPSRKDILQSSQRSDMLLWPKLAIKHNLLVDLHNGG